LSRSIAPRPEDWPRLLDKMGEAMKKDFAHAVEMFGLLGGGKRDAGWDGSGRPKSRLAILPGLTHYTIFSDPSLAATVIPFLDEPATAGR